MSTTIINSQLPTPVAQTDPPQAPKKDTTLDKGLKGVANGWGWAQDNIIDNNLVLGAGTAVTGIATVAGVAQIADKVPAVKDGLEFIFVKNGLLTGGAVALGTSALLTEDAIASFKEGDTGKAVGEGAVAAVAGLGGAELVGRQFNIPVLKQALSKPVEILVKNGLAVTGTVLTAGSLAAIKSGVDDLQEGSSVSGGLKTLGGSVGLLGGAELIGRQYDIPVVKKALSGPAEWVGHNVKAVTGGITALGGGAALVKGVMDVKDGKTLQGSAEIAGGTAAVLGGAELIGRQYGIPYMKEALTGPIKAIFTSKGGIVASGAVVAGAGLTAAGDGVRRLTTQKGILNDAIGAAEVTAGVTAATGGVSIIGYATGSEKLMRVFPENLQILGGVGLLSGAAALGKHTVDDVKANGMNLENTGKTTAGVLLTLGGTQLIADKLGVPLLDQAFSKGWQPALGAGLGYATFKLGQHTVEQGKEFLETPTTGKGAVTVGLGVATTLAGAGSAGLIGHGLNIPVLAKGSDFVFRGLQKAGIKTLEGVKTVTKPVVEAAVEHPFITLGVVAAAGTGLYLYHRYTKDDESEAKNEPKTEKK